jgi:hypothetical protein
MTNLMMQLSGTASDRDRDAARISSWHTPTQTATKNSTDEQPDAISGWEDEGGAGLSDQRGKEIAQSAADQMARRNREDLKRPVAGRLTPAAGKKFRKK